LKKKLKINPEPQQIQIFKKDAYLVLDLDRGQPFIHHSSHSFIFYFSQGAYRALFSPPPLQPSIRCHPFSLRQSKTIILSHSECEINNGAGLTDTRVSQQTYYIINPLFLSFSPFFCFFVFVLSKPHSAYFVLPAASFSHHSLQFASNPMFIQLTQ